MNKLRVLEMSGTPYEMGYTHGKAFAEEIRAVTEDRVALSMDPTWTGRNLSREAVLELAAACVQAHEDYAPELMEELRGMSDATGMTLGDLVIANGYTDFIDVVYGVGDLSQQASAAQKVSDNCTAFLIPSGRSADGHGVYGQTWDMNASATPHVVLLRGKPAAGPSFLTFTITGCVGMIGMNDQGIAVGINNLLGGDGQIGVTWPFVIRRILAQTTLQDALECIISAPLAGAHNYLLMDKTGRGYNVEAMSTRYHVEALEADPLVHTNHCLVPRNHEVERARPEKSLKSSQNRLARGKQILNEGPVTIDMLMALTRDAEAICVRANTRDEVESSGAAIMRPATGDFWAVWGLPTENEYEHFVI